MIVLLVEDSEEVSCIAVEYLHELGHQAVAVDTAEKAIAQLKKRKFDAMMTDISLPGMSGIQLALQVLKDYPNQPVILCSGYRAFDVKSLFGDQGCAVLVLPKPYDLPAMEDTLAEAAAISGRMQASRRSPVGPCPPV